MPEIEEQVFRPSDGNMPEPQQVQQNTNEVRTIDFNCRLPSIPMYEDILKEYRIDLTKEYPDIDYLLKYKGVGCIPRGDIQGLGGRMKNGKTTAALCMIVAMLKGNFMGFEATRGNYKCLIIDTEQGVLNAASKIRVIHRLLGWKENENNDRMVSLSIRGASLNERIKLITAAVDEVQPDFILLDGIVDICEDFNNPADSQKTIQFMMRLSAQKKCAITCVLHANKKDEELRGHLGTELMNKCSEFYIVRKSGDIANVEQAACRNEPLQNWAFTFGENGMPEAASILSNADKKKDKLSEGFAEIFREKSEYTYKELCDKCMDEFHVQIDMAKKKIKSASEYFIISKDEKGFYHFGDINDFDEPDNTEEYESLY